jgi:hypothetical protein
MLPQVWRRLHVKGQPDTVIRDVKNNSPVKDKTMTVQEAKVLRSGTPLHHVSKTNADGTPMRAKVTSVKTWKRSPERVEVRVKRGLYEYASFDEREV